MGTAQKLLDEAVEGRDLARPDARAAYACLSGQFFKGYPHGASADGQIELWHGYPIARERVKFEVPARVLKRMRDAGALSGVEYRRLRGGAR